MADHDKVAIRHSTEHLNLKLSFDQKETFADQLGSSSDLPTTQHPAERRLLRPEPR